MASDPLIAPRTATRSGRARAGGGWCLRLDPALFAGPPFPPNTPPQALRRLDRGGPSARSPTVAEAEGFAALLDGETRDGRSAAGILGLYRERGIDGLAELRGRFSCIVIDRRRGLVIAQRDPLGHRPLFWARGPRADGRPGRPGRALLLSDSIDRLLGALGGQGTGRDADLLDRTAIAGFLCDRWPGPSETFHRPIRRVRPGFLLLARGGEIDEIGERRYHRFEPPRGDGGDPGWSSDEESDRFPELFGRVVARSATAGERAPVGISLSSGLDSVSVAVAAAAAARRSGVAPPRAFCLGFAAPECDERHDQRRVAARLGMEATFLPAPLPTATAGPLHELVALAPRLPAPPVNPLLPSFRRLYAAAAREGIGTVLTGNGGDEWLGVTPLLGADLLRAGRWPELWELGRSIQRSVRLPAARVWWNQLWRFGLRPLASEAAARSFGRPWAEARARRARGRMPAWLRPELARELAERVRAEVPPAGDRSFYEREIERSVDHPLVSITREEMADSARATGVALHAPFEDDEMVEHLVRAAPRRLLQGGRSKGLVREYLRGRLGAEGSTEDRAGIDLHHQRKVSFTQLFRDAVRREAADCAARLARSGGPDGSGGSGGSGGFGMLADLGVVEPGALLRAIERADRLRTGAETLPIWSALVMESWLRGEGST